MRQIEFETTVDAGTITVPSEHRDRIHGRVRVIIITDEDDENIDMIEDYPTDKYGPSVLILGFTQEQRPIHIQCSYPSRPLIKIITAYQPDEQRWIDYRIRRTA